MAFQFSHGPSVGPAKILLRPCRSLGFVSCRLEQSLGIILQREAKQEIKILKTKRQIKYFTTEVASLRVIINFSLCLINEIVLENEKLSYSEGAVIPSDHKMSMVDSIRLKVDLTCKYFSYSRQ